MSTGQQVPNLKPESLYSFEPGIRFQSERASASFTAFGIGMVVVLVIFLVPALTTGSSPGRSQVRVALRCTSANP